MKEERKLSVGAYLSEERKRKNISLAEIAKVTRISLQFLEALEKDEFQTLPASIFVRGFLRTYAIQIGLDPKEVLDRYEAQVVFLIEPGKKEAVPPPKKLEPLVKYILTLFIVVLGVGIAFFFLKENSIPPTSSPPSPEISPAQKPTTKPPRSDARSSRERGVLKELEVAKQAEKLESLPAASPAAAETSKKEGKRYVLKVKAIEKTWLRIQSDDQPEFEALLQPEEIATWTARRQFKILVGNAGGIEVFLNGNFQGPLGQSGQVVNLLLPNEENHP